MLSAPVRAYDPLLRLAGGATPVAAQQLALIATERSAACILRYGSHHRCLHTVKNDVRSNDKLQQLQAELGYKFRSPHLLQQALSKDGHKLLAFLGDIAVRMLFEEYAFHAAIKAGHVNVLTPHLNVLVTRQHFTAVALYKWHLHTYIALEGQPLSTIKTITTPSPSTTSSVHGRKPLKRKKANSTTTSSNAAQPTIMGSIFQPISSSVSNILQRLWPGSSSSRNGSAAVSGIPAPVISKPIVDARLAETVEAVIAAILLDSNYSTLQATMKPWVASTCETTKKFMANQAAPPAAAAQAPAQAAAAAAAIATAQGKLEGKKQSRAPLPAAKGAKALARKQQLMKQLLIECLSKQLQSESAATTAAACDVTTSAAAATVDGAEHPRVGSSVAAAAAAADGMFSLLRQHQQQWQSLMQQLQQQQVELQQLLLQKQQELVQQQQQMQFRLLQQQQEQWCEMSLQQQQQVHQLVMQLADQQQQLPAQEAQQQQQQCPPSPAPVVSSLKNWSSVFRPVRRAADTAGAAAAAVNTPRFSQGWVAPAPPSVSVAAAGAAETIKAITITQQQQDQWQQQWQEQQQQWFASILHGRVHTVCGYTFRDSSIAQHCSKLLWHKMVVAGAAQGTTSSDFPKQIEVWSQMGNWLTRFAAVQRSWRVHCRSGLNAAVFDVHQTAEQLNNRYHRARIMLWVGLDPAFWCPSGSAFYNLKWDQQAERLGHCLFLLLTAVYLDGGMTAALDVTEVLLANTPQTVVCHSLRKNGPRTTDVDLSWVPQWGKCGGDYTSRITAEMDAAASTKEDAAAAGGVAAADDELPRLANEASAEQKVTCPNSNAGDDKATTPTTATAKTATSMNASEATATAENAQGSKSAETPQGSKSAEKAQGSKSAEKAQGSKSAEKTQGSKSADAGEQTPAAAGKPLATVTTTITKAAPTGQTQTDMPVGSSGTGTLVLTEEMMLALKKSNPDAAAALLQVLAGQAASTQAGSAKPATATPTTGKTDKRLLDVKQVEITKGATVEILVQYKGKNPLAVATATVDSVDIAGNVVLDAAAKAKVKPGLVLLKKVTVAEAQEKTARTVMLWQTYKTQNVKEGSTSLWDAKVPLENGMKLPVPRTVLRVVPLKATTQK